MKAANANARQLERALKRRDQKMIKVHHDNLLRQLRDLKADAPNWDAFPLARTYFTQRYP